MAGLFSSQVAGVLRLDAHFGDSWEAVELLAVPFFNGQQVAVTFECGAVPNADTIQVADAALLNFLALGEAERLASADAVLANYEGALANDGPPLQLIAPVDIWKYVEPRHLHVISDEEATPDIYLLVEAEWEPEHGIQLVFRQGRMLTRASQYDGHLTESQAESIPEEKDALMMQYYAKFGRPSIHTI